MNGKQHLVSGAVLGTMGISVTALMGESERLAGAAAKMTEFLGPSGLPEAVMCGLCYFGGCLLPDIDQPGSLLGRYVHVEAEHRTWTHSIYPILAVVFLGRRFPPALWLALGMLAHVLMDSVSKCGVAWVRCFGGYRRYGTGAKIRKGWHLVLYTGETSAWVVCTVLAMLALGCLWVAREPLFGPMFLAMTEFRYRVVRYAISFIGGIAGHFGGS